MWDVQVSIHTKTGITRVNFSTITHDSLFFFLGGGAISPGVPTQLRARKFSSSLPWGILQAGGQKARLVQIQGELWYRGNWRDIGGMGRIVKQSLGGDQG